MNIWKVLQEQAIEHTGKTIETALLGEVLPIKTNRGELTGFVPPVLQKEANEYGMVIEVALWKEGRYVLRLLPCAFAPYWQKGCTMALPPNANITGG